ncbi:MAG: T9SS type A sorting domain-containing protein, partial [Flavobacteriia bacterium]|nr:T9SS type A sorting domain-containing protein [Flavobacteriia bacterium]
YPNPNNGAFTVKLSGSLERKITIRIYDLRGRTIYNKTHQNVGDFTAEIQLNQAQSGMYLLNISDGVRKETKKLVIK